MNVETFGKSEQATDGNTGIMGFACWTAKVTDTHSEHVTLVFFPTVTIVTQAGLIVTFIHKIPVLMRYV
jgi:hypothetical protein